MKKAIINLVALSLLTLVTGCSQTKEPAKEDSSSLSSSVVKVSSNAAASSSTGPSIIDNQLSTASGLTVSFNNRGARISSITWNRSNIAKDGFTVGRVANRIAGGRFTLNSTVYNVTKNADNNTNSLHGGSNQWQGPFANATWKKEEQTTSTIRFSYTSPSGDNGYPGKLDAEVKYSLSEEGQLTIEYTAHSDADTLYNPTNHLYMMPNGNTSYDNIKLQIDADNYNPLNSSNIPTGVSTVEGTIFDYREEKTFQSSNSYDHNLVLNGTGYRKVATMKGTTLGIKIEVYTDRAGLQLYKDNNNKAICLESQMLPDMINHPEFDTYGTTILRANEEFYSKTAYVFSAIQ